MLAASAAHPPAVFPKLAAATVGRYPPEGPRQVRRRGRRRGRRLLRRLHRHATDVTGPEEVVAQHPLDGSVGDVADQQSQQHVVDVVVVRVAAGLQRVPGDHVDRLFRRPAPAGVADDGPHGYVLVAQPADHPERLPDRGAVARQAMSHVAGQRRVEIDLSGAGELQDLRGDEGLGDARDAEHRLGRHRPPLTVRC